jgi:hypothetical protein
MGLPKAWLVWLGVELAVDTGELEFPCGGTHKHDGDMESDADGFHGLM